MWVTGVKKNRSLIKEEVELVQLSIGFNCQHIFMKLSQNDGLD